MRLHFWTIFSVMLFSSLLSQAQSFSVGTPQLSGNGCPRGTARAIVAPDSSSISLIFDRFSVSAPRGSVNEISVGCLFSVPITQMPPNTTLRAIGIDYRGFVNLPKSAMAFIRTSNRIWVPDSEAFPAITEKGFLAPPTSSFLENFNERVSTNQGYPKVCSNNTKVEVKTDLVLRPGAIRQGRRFRAIPFETDAALVIDSADLAGAADLRIAVDLEPCTNDRNVGGCLPNGAVIEGTEEDSSDGYREVEEDRCCSGWAYRLNGSRPICGRRSSD